MHSQEQIPRAFIDLETAGFRAASRRAFPIPTPSKQVPLEKFAAAVLPAISPAAGRPADRPGRGDGGESARLEKRFRSILLVVSVLDWPWIKDAYFSKRRARPETRPSNRPEIHGVDPRTLLFVLGELPFITGLYERARAELDDDENLSIDGVKELLQVARERYQADFKNRGRRLTPQLFAQYLKYVRNLSLDRAADDSRPVHADHRGPADRRRPVRDSRWPRRRASIPYLPSSLFRRWPRASIAAGCRTGRGGDEKPAARSRRDVADAVAAGQARTRNAARMADALEPVLRIAVGRRKTWPSKSSARTSRTRPGRSWGSIWPAAKNFAASLMDGLDIRETLRNWHTGELYVKVTPPTRGSLDCVVMLFDSPADPRDYPWRTTWMAEHHDESTLALFATNFRAGDGRSGDRPGDVRRGRVSVSAAADRRHLERPAARFRRHARRTRARRPAACTAITGTWRCFSYAPPGAGWRRMARRFGKKLVHVPLHHFSQETVQQLRLVHVLNGRQVRSYAADFIRKA